MSIAQHLTQSVTLYNRASKNEFNEASFGSGSTVKCRFQERYKLIEDANGEQIETDASAWFKKDTTIDKHDKITYRSKDWEVVQVFNRQGREDIHHIQVFLRKL